MLRASVVVPVRNSESALTAQLDALARQTIVGTLEIIVVDDASTDRTPAVASGWIAEHAEIAVRLVRRASRGGPNAARNDGIRLATTPNIVLCDGDDVVAPDWAEHLLGALEASNQPTLVSGRCVSLHPDDTLSDHTTIGAVTHDGTPYMLGGNGGFRRTLAHDIGGFDEQILEGGSEVDFGFRAIDHGATVRYVAHAVVGYREPITTAGLFRREFRRSRGAAYIGLRHPTRSSANSLAGVFVLPWKKAAFAVWQAGTGTGRQHAVAKAFGRALGMTWWGARLRWRTPPQILGLADD